MNKRYWIFALTLSLTLCQRTEQEIAVGTITETKTLSAGTTHSYKVTLARNVTGEEMFLVFNAFPSQDDLSDPDVYISDKIPFPTLETAEWRCQSYGQDVCLVPKEFVLPDRVFHVTIYCKEECHYKLAVSLRVELNLEEGIQVESTLSAAKTRLYRLAVPNDPSIRSISVSLNLLRVANISSARMFVAKVTNESTVPSSDNTMRVVPTWLGLTSKIYDSDKDWFCTNCVYRVLITSKEDIHYGITYKISKAYTKLKNDDNLIFDTIKAGERNCYRYKVRDNKQDLEIKLNPFNGDPDIYVNPEELPMDMSKFAFNTSGKSTESLIITAKELQKHSSALSYFICVFGVESSAYQLTVNMQKHNETRKYSLNCGFTQTMTVDQYELMVFKLPLTTNRKINITFTLISITGDADLFIKKCMIPVNEYGVEKEECTLTRNEFFNEEILRSTNTSSVDFVRLETDEKCNTEKVRCSYLVGVFGARESRFSLTATCSDYYQLPLAESVPYYGAVEPRTHAHFIFTVEHPWAASVKIQLTANSGLASLYVSRVDPFCTSECNVSSKRHMPNILTYTKGNDGYLNTTYYVSVYGNTFAFFSLVYSVVYEDSSAMAIELYDGTPMIGSLSGTETVFYKIRVNFREKEQQQIKIFVSPMRGAVDAYVEVGKLPSKESYRWRLMPFENAITIRSSDKGYESKAVYYLLVARLNPNDTSNCLFSVKYLTGNHIIALLEGYPEIGNITQFSSEFYKYYVNEPEKGVYVTVTPFLGDPDLFISVSPGNKMPTNINNDYSSTRVGADSLNLTQSSISQKNPACNPKQFSYLECVIYISVYCASQECSYTLQVSQIGNLPLRLIEGLPQFGIVTNTMPQFYIITPDTFTNTSDAVVSIHPKLGKIKAFAILLNNEFFLSEYKNKLPSPSNHEIASFDRINTQVLILKKDDSCMPFCQYLVGVYCDDSEKSEYTIITTSNFLRLIDGQAAVDSVAASTFKYYLFRVPCTTCTISISLVPFTDGDPDLYILKGSYRLPDEKNCDFRSTSFRGEFLQLSQDMEFFRNQSISGTYTIGVYGKTNCTYSLVATTSAEIIDELSLGIPVKHKQEKGKIKYFKFLSWRNADIKVALATYNGRVTIRANVVVNPSEINIMDKLPINDQKSTWSSQRMNSNNFLMIYSRTPVYKANGTYIISVESLESTIYDIVVEYRSDQDYTMLKLGDTLYERMTAGAAKMYGFIVGSQSDITISLFITYGSVSAKVAALESKNIHWTIPENGKVIIEASKDKDFVIGMYYIMIKTKTEAVFNLLVEQSKHLVILREGQPYSGSLICEDALYFFYYLAEADSNIKQEKRQFNVYVKFYEPVYKGWLQIYKVGDGDEFPTKSKAMYVAGYDQDLGHLGYSFDVTTFKENIGIKLEANFSSAEEGMCVRYEIIAWTTGIASMIPDFVYMNSFVSAGEMHTYELFVYKSSTIYIEVTPCLGEVEFVVTKSLNEIADRKYDIKASNVSYGKLFGIFEASKGVYYISVRGNSISSFDPISGKGIWYTIKQTSPDQLEPYETANYIVENSGDITYTVSSSEILLSWGSIVKKNKNKFDDVTYTIYMDDTGKSNMQTACGMSVTKAALIASNVKTPSLHWKIEKKYQNRKLTFNVIAHIKDLNQVITYNPVVYHPGQSTSIWTYVIVFVVAIVVGVICYYKKRTEIKVEKQNNTLYEMANIKSDTSMN